MTRLNGHAPDLDPQPMIPRSTYDKLRRRYEELEIRFRSVYQAKTQLEENIAVERQIWKRWEDGR